MITLRMQSDISVLLRSEAILGSGLSRPGGEDIAVKTDSSGRPYLSGSTWKGLLREATANWLEWEIPPIAPGEDRELAADRITASRKNAAKRLDDLFGGCGSGEWDNWHDGLTSRKVTVTPLRLADKTLEGEDLLVMRAFTQMGQETGTVASGTLRTAACIRRGTVFQGRITCPEGDCALLTSALRCIKNIGTMRSRGFGRVEVRVHSWLPVVQPAAVETTGTGDVLSYTLRLIEPVRITDLGGSYNTYLESRSYLPAAALRGAVLTALSRDAEWFLPRKRQLLRGLRFTDGVPCRTGGKPVISTPRGFYEDKLGNEFYSLPVTRTAIPGTKRAKLPVFCTLEDATDSGTVIRPAGLNMGSETRINQQDETGKMFQSRNILPGQIVRAEILFPCGCPEEVRQRVVKVLSGDLRLGANICSGFGLCRAESIRWTKDTPERAAYGYREGDKIGKTLYLLLLSPLTLSDDYGEPCGLSREYLTCKLGVEVSELFCCTSFTEGRGFNRTYGTRLPEETMYDRGSVFCLTCQEVPKLEDILRLERDGIGTGRTEGRGRVLFLRDLSNITGKSGERFVQDESAAHRAVLRREVTKWLLQQKRVPGELSNSQLGQFEAAFCQTYESRAQALEALDEWLQRISRTNEEKGTVHGEYRDKAQPLYEFVQNFLNDNALAKQLQLRDVNEQVRLLRHLIRLGRKEV